MFPLSEFLWRRAEPLEPLKQLYPDLFLEGNVSPAFNVHPPMVQVMLLAQTSSFIW